jgi:intein-encoded DNA endonuclease-like protein
MAQIQIFKNLFKKYGHIYVGKIRGDGNREFLARLNRTFNFLLPKKDNIPKWVRINKKYFLSFLAGYTDAEGYIGIGSKNVAFLALASYDKNILKQIHKQLIKLGVECKSPRISVKKGHIKSDGLVYRNNYWRFTINRKSSLFPVLRLLKSRLKHQKRLNDLIKAEQNIIKRNQRTLPKKASLKYLPV